MKYYKTNKYYMLRTKDLIPQVRKLLKAKECAIWTTFDLKKNKIIFEYYLFSDIWNTEDTRKRIRKIYDRIWWILEWKLKITRYMNRKDIATEMVKQSFIKALTKENSPTYNKAEIRWSTLRGILITKGIRGHLHIEDNVVTIGDITSLLSEIGRSDKAIELWDIWMKSKCGKNDRIKFRKACNKELLKMVIVK